jgi:DHA2 family multidrug resistance protein
VPLGVIAAVIVGGQLRHRVEQIEKPKMDYVGLVTLVIGVGCLQLLLDLGNEEDWFASTRIVVLACVAVVALAVFLIWELTDKDPIVDLRLLRHRNFRAGTLAMIVGYAAFFSVALMIPLWLQRDLGYTSIWAGLATAPLGILPIMLAPLLGKYGGKLDMRMLASMAFLVLSITCFLRSGFNLQVNFAHVAGIQLLMGAGVALFFMPVLQILLSDLDGREVAAGSGLATFLRTLGGSFAASLTTWLWSRRTQQHHADLTAHISVYEPGMHERITAMGQGDLQHGAALLDNMIGHQASQMGFNDIFLLLGWVFLAIIVFLWLAKPPFGAGAGAASAGGH